MEMRQDKFMDEATKAIRGEQPPTPEEKKPEGDVAPTPKKDDNANDQTLGQVAEQPEKPKAGEPEAKPKVEDKKPSSDEKVVPEWQYLKLKGDFKKVNKTTKEMASIMKDLVATVETLKSGNAGKSEEADELSKFAKQWEVPDEFVKGLATVLGKDKKEATKLIDTAKEDDDSDQDDDEDEDDDTPPEPEKIDNTRLSKAVDTQLTKFLEDMPEYSDLVNPEVVKAFVLANPTKNINKSIGDVVEEIYGKALKGSKGFEPSRPRRNGDNEIDTSNVDDKTLGLLKEDKQQKAKYDEGLIERAKHYFK